MRNGELTPDFTFSGVTRFRRAARKDEVSHPPCLVERDRLVDPLSINGRRPIAPRGSAQDQACIGICVN